MVHSNNALNWITREKSIIVFDLGSEKFHEVPLPHHVSHFEINCCKGLFAFCNTYGRDMGYEGIWCKTRVFYGDI